MINSVKVDEELECNNICVRDEKDKYDFKWIR